LTDTIKAYIIKNIYSSFYGEIKMSVHTDAIKAAMESFLAEDEKFEAGNGAAGTRARKALQELAKAIKERRKEITDTKNSRKEAKLNG
jgi:hypothetical protein